MDYNVIIRCADLFQKLAADPRSSHQEDIIVEWEGDELGKFFEPIDPKLEPELEEEIPIDWADEKEEKELLESLDLEKIRTELLSEEEIFDPWKQLRYFADRSEINILIPKRKRNDLDIDKLLDWITVYILNKKGNDYPYPQVPQMVYLPTEPVPTFSWEGLVNRTCSCGKEYSGHKIFTETTELSPQIYEAEGNIPREVIELRNCGCGSTLALPHLAAGLNFVSDTLLKLAELIGAPDGT